MSSALNQDGIFFAKWLYQSWNLFALQPIGPGYRLPPGGSKVEQTLRPGLERVVGEGEQVADRIWTVPSPWHAALYLGSLQHHLSESGQHAVFRGQCNSDWPIVSSISRVEAQGRERERVRARLFCEVLGALSLNWTRVFHPSYRGELDLRVPVESYLAAAQHYEIPTELIDFTADPSIAVLFACRGRVSGSAPPTASVHVLPLDNALDNGCEILLPPPFVRRLYLQRGMFIRSEHPLDSGDLGILEIRFPREHSFGPFEVVRPGVGFIDVLQDSAQIGEVLGLVDTELIQAPPEEIGDKTALVVERLKNSFSKVAGDPFGMWAEYVDGFEEILYWTAYAVDSDSENLNLRIVDSVASSNRDLAAGVAQMYRFVTSLTSEVSALSEKKRAHLLALADLLERPPSEGGD